LSTTIEEREERRTRAAARWDRAVAAVNRGRSSVDRSRLLMSSRAVLDRLHPPFSGGAASLLDEATVRQRVRGLIDGGALTHIRSGRVWVGPCRVRHCCTVCGRDIEVVKPEVQICSSTGRVMIQLHATCFHIWNEEARNGGGTPRS
jgi:hypothetical protein